MPGETPNISSAWSDAAALADSIAACPRCQTDLARLPGIARFCPRCGSDLNEVFQRGRVGSSSVTVDAEAPGAMFFPQPPAAPAPAQKSILPPPLPDGRIHSLMLRGYASALFRLGWRYERSLGASNHPDEAVRCYTKAARLGNEPARARLGLNQPVDSPSVL